MLTHNFLVPVMHLTVREVYIHQTENHILWFHHVMNERESKMRLVGWLAIVSLVFCLNASGPTWAAGPPERQAMIEATGTRAPTGTRPTAGRIAALGISAISSFRPERMGLLWLAACSKADKDMLFESYAQCVKDCRGLNWDPGAIHTCSHKCLDQQDQKASKLGC